MSSALKGPSQEGGSDRERERARAGQRGRGYTGGSVRDTLGEKGYWGHTSTPQPKEGACEGKAEAAVPALGWYHVKLSASSLFLHRRFVSHANSGSGPNLPGQALRPNWQGREKEEGVGGGVLQMGWGVRV